jgi:uncharacterized protein (DUF58 family)
VSQFSAHEAVITYGNEPPTPRAVRWRVAIYPVALAFGALSAAARPEQIGLKVAAFAVFTGLMLTPLALRLQAWGGLRRAWRWFFLKRLSLTRGGFVFITITILFGVAAINTGTNLLYLILAMLLSLIVVSGMLSEVNVKGLRISRRMPPYVFAGEEVRIAIVLTNPRRYVPSFAIEVRESAGPFAEGGGRGEGPLVAVFRLDPGERRPLFYAATLPRRGVFALDGFVLATRFPFGFFTKFARADLPAELVVFPTPRELAKEAVRALGRADDRPRPKPFHNAPDEFRATREYRSGDNPRFIHWRSSARRRRLVVKEFEPRATRTSAVVLDADTGLAGEEAVRAIDRGTTLAASLVEHLTRQGERPELALALHGGPRGPAVGRRAPEVVRFGAPGAAQEGGAAASRRGATAYLEALARLAPGLDPAHEALVEAAAPALRRGSRVFVLTARDPGEARRALEAQEPSAAFGLDVISFASEVALAALYAAEDAGEGPISRVKLHRKLAGAAGLGGAPKKRRAGEAGPGGGRVDPVPG